MVLKIPFLSGFESLWDFQSGLHVCSNYFFLIRGGRYNCYIFYVNFDPNSYISFN